MPASPRWYSPSRPARSMRSRIGDASAGPFADRRNDVSEAAMPGPLTNRTAFVTAAGQGIGRATALAFAAAGARVIATDVDVAKVQSIASDAITTAALDVLRPDAIAQAASDAGPIDILFNCAGFVHQGTLLQATEAEWEFGF